MGEGGGGDVDFVKRVPFLLSVGILVYSRCKYSEGILMTFLVLIVGE